MASHCQNGRCCIGGDCCSAASQCPAIYTTPPTCLSPSVCDGRRFDAVCNSFVCGTSSEIDDDSACTVGTTANTCSTYADVFCNGQVTQSAPACGTTCSTSTQSKSRRTRRSASTSTSPPKTRGSATSGRACADQAQMQAQVAAGQCKRVDAAVFAQQNLPGKPAVDVDGQIASLTCSGQQGLPDALHIVTNHRVVQVVRVGQRQQSERSHCRKADPQVEPPESRPPWSADRP